MVKIKQQLKNNLGLSEAQKLGKPLWKYLAEKKKINEVQRIYFQGFADGANEIITMVKPTLEEVSRNLIEASR
jgi:hypothetical protein